VTPQRFTAGRILPRGVAARALSVEPAAAAR